MKTYLAFFYSKINIKIYSVEIVSRRGVSAEVLVKDVIHLGHEDNTCKGDSHITYESNLFNEMFLIRELFTRFE